ncbi:N-acetylglucosamine kinase [Dictyobacter vulcani]|uniref:N-acetylglucosamine kinase n=1 Tax=Dictyobacter vulcani TaxID=2607529 RepID=A0A5J4KK71_9CHLR|nr:BadF/BadG/BcrA/BcrD ATPase family protein [Dictyobacter vulcani]GER88225.1 N-acetylglucosamine kinase [Dictyobacter vulcani]
MNISATETTNESYYLGVDGGGSKTLAVIVNAHGEEVGRGQSGSSNYTSVGVDKAISNIYAAIEEARLPLGTEFTITKAWLGLAAVDRPADHANLAPRLQGLAQTVFLTNDAELALSTLPAAVGIVLIAGTGSISLGRNAQGVTSRAGGWGYLLGDEGSGYALGSQALQAAVRAADGRGPHTLLLERILAFWQLERPDQLIGEVYFNPGKAKIARLSTCVMQAEQEGDPIAQELVQHAISELVLAVKTVARKLDMPLEQPLPLALGGGLLVNELSFQKRFLDLLSSTQTLGEIVLVEYPALSAARAVIDIIDFNHWIRV